MKVLIGADPELFLQNVDGKFISSIGHVGGTKYSPRSIGQGCAVQEDNVAAEINIPPADTVEKFITSCNYALMILTQELAEKALFLNLSASKVFDEDQLVDPKARTFGCDPDINAWTRKQNPPPIAKNPNLRSAGGHIHIGCTLPKLKMARWCDVMLGLPSVLEDENTERRELYGKAGAFRSKPYGIEYRTLSNYWLRDSNTMSKVFERAQAVASVVKSGYVLKDQDGTAIQAAINHSNKEAAKNLIDKYQDLYGLNPSLFETT